MARKDAIKDAIKGEGKLQKQPNTLRTLLESENYKKRFQDMLGIKTAGFISSILSLYNSKIELQTCDPSSIIAAAAIAASLDLPINPSLQFAHIVPYSNKAQFQMGWRGFVQLGMRSGQYKSMNVGIVHEGEIKSYNKITGDIEFQESDSDKIIGYCFYFKLLNGFEKYFYMTKEEVEKHGKRYSKSYGSTIGQWHLNFDVMAMKTVTKLGLSKWGILSVAMERAITLDQVIADDDAKGKYLDSTQDSDIIDIQGQAEKGDVPPQSPTPSPVPE